MISGMAMEQLFVRIMGDKSHLDKVYAGAVKQTQQLADKLGAIGMAMTKYVTAPIVAVGGLSVHAFADFDHAMTESTALIKLTGEEIEALKAKALELGAKFPMGPVKAAEAYYELFSAGMSAKQAIASLEPIMRFAAAGAFDLKTATALAEGALSALGMMSHDTGEQIANTTAITNHLVKASTLVSGTVEEFGRALTRDFGSVMKMYNISLSEGVAILASFHKQQIRGAMAGNMAARMMRLVMSAAFKHADAWKAAGIAVYDAGGNLRTTMDILKDFERVMGQMSDLEKIGLLDKLGLKTLSQKALTPLIGKSGDIAGYIKQFETMGDVTQDVSDRQLAGFSNQMKVLINQLKIVGIEIGEMIAPAIRALAEGVKELIAGWKQLSPATKQFILIAAGIAAAIGPLLLAAAAIPMIFGAIASGAAILGPILPILIGLGVAVGGFILASGGVEQAWQNIQQAARQFTDWFMPIWKAASDLLVAVWPLVQEAAKATWDWIASNLMRLAEGVRTYVGFMLGDFTMSWTEIRDTVVEALRLATFAVENFEVAARWAAVKIAQHFYNMANQITLGVGGMVDDFTLGIGKALKEEEEAAKLAFAMWKKQRADAAKAGDNATAVLPTPSEVAKATDKARATGKSLGKAMKEGFKQEADRIDAALWGSAEALSRIAEYRDKIRRADGVGGGVKPPTAPMVPGQRQGAEPPGPVMNQVVEILKDIRDNTKDDGDGIDLDVADLE